jgi:hypothetical protein
MLADLQNRPLARLPTPLPVLVSAQKEQAMTGSTRPTVAALGLLFDTGSDGHVLL